MTVFEYSSLYRRFTHNINVSVSVYLDSYPLSSSLLLDAPGNLTTGGLRAKSYIQPNSQIVKYQHLGYHVDASQHVHLYIQYIQGLDITKLAN